VIQLRSDFCNRDIPADLVEPASRIAAQWAGQAQRAIIGIERQAPRLLADITERLGVVLIALDALHLAVFDLNLDAAIYIAQDAGRLAGCDIGHRG
jgi:hypothetical protein